MKYDSLGNLLGAVNVIRQKATRERNRQKVIEQFNNKELHERQQLYAKYKRNRKAYLGNISDYDILSIMGYFRQAWEEIDK